MKNTGAFSIVELLVVMAILLVLMGIYLVVMNGAKSKSQQVACMANLSQIGKSFRLYADDYDDRLPPYAAESGRGRSMNMTSQPGLLKLVLADYGSSGDLFYCPADKHKKTAVDTGWGDNSLHTSYMHSHDINWLRNEKSTWLDLVWSSVPSTNLYSLFYDRYMEEWGRESAAHDGLTCSVFFDLHTECYSSSQFFARLAERESPR